MEEVFELAARRRALLGKIRKLEREMPELSNKLLLRRHTAWREANALADVLHTKKADLVATREQLAAFDRDVGNQ